MNKRCFYLFLVLYACACTPDEDFSIVPGNPDLELTPDASSSIVINEDVFSILNLNYPGLETVNMLLEAEDTTNAVKALQQYYRTRPVLNPNVNMLSTAVTAEQTNIANQAILSAGFRFKVADYLDQYDRYYSFKDPQSEEIDWDFVPEEAAGDQNFKMHLHSHEWMLPQAMVFKTTANTKYLNGWIKVYFDWLENFPCPEGATADPAWSGLAPALRVLDQVSIMYYYLPHSYFTPALLTEFIVAFQDHIDSILANWDEDTTSEVRLMQEKAVAIAGMLMPEFIDAPVWRKTGCDAVCNQLKERFGDDGVYESHDIVEHVESLDDYFDVFKVAQVNGYVSEFDADYVNIFNSAVQFILDVMYPDYSIETFNESRTALLTDDVLTDKYRRFLEILPENGTLEWRAYHGQSGKAPVTTMMCYPDAGFYIMKNGWGNDSMMLVHKNSSVVGEGPNDHYDNGHISLYVGGRRFLPDAGSGASASNVHNTVIKGGTESIESRAGRLLKSETAAGYELVVTENPSYQDLTHRRAIFFVDRKFFVIVDEAYGTYSGSVSLRFNLWGGKGDGPQSPVSGVASAMCDEYTDETAACGVHSCFDDENNLLMKTYSETSGGYVFNSGTGYFSNAPGEQTRRWWYESSVMKAEDKAARFVTIILPFSAKGEFDDQKLSAVFVDNPNPENAGSFHGNEGAAVKVTVNGRDYSLSYNLN